MKIRNGITYNDTAQLIPANRVTWEYLCVLLHRNPDLSRYGIDGWELVSAISQPADMAMFYFRRRK